MLLCETQRPTSVLVCEPRLCLASNDHWTLHVLYPLNIHRCYKAFRVTDQDPMWAAHWVLGDVRMSPCSRLSPLCSWLGVGSFISLQYLTKYGYRLVTACSSWLYSAASLGNQAARTKQEFSWYPIRSNYLDTELTSLCSILLMPSARPGSEKYQFHKSLVWLNWGTKLYSTNSTTAACAIKLTKWLN